MQFDKEYFDKLYSFFNAGDSIVYNVSDLADNTEKFIAYTKYYQHVRTLDDAEVTISFDKTQIYITEFFDNVLMKQTIEALKGIGQGTEALVDTYNNLAPTNLGASIEEVQSSNPAATPPIKQVKKSPFQK